MSLENVKKFYAHLAIDEAFQARVTNAKSKEECSQIVKAAGYEFTTQELEEYTAQLMNPPDDLSPLDKAELEAVVGGFNALRKPWPWIQPLYGVIWPPDVKETM
jgi:predicted ribosomally synthesized peptide with nif11-like leader